MALQQISDGDTGEQAANKIYENDVENRDLAQNAQSKADEIEEVSTRTSQLFDASTLLSGYYNINSGGVIATTNWLRTPLILLDGTATDVTTSGIGLVPSGSARFVFFDATQTFISGVASSDSTTTPKTAAIPNNAKYVGITVANALGQGADPSTSPFAGTVMVNYGTTALPWEFYGRYLEGDKIQNMPDYVEEAVVKINEVTLEGSQLFDGTTLLSGYYNINSGGVLSSNNWVRTPLIAIGGSETITVSGIGNVPGISARFVFFDATQTFISGVTSFGSQNTTPHTVTTPANTEFVGITIANALDAGLDLPNSPYVTSLMLNYGPNALAWEAYDPNAVYLDGTKIRGGTTGGSSNPETYVSVNPTGYNGQSLVKIYSLVRGNVYVCYEVGRFKDDSELVYADIWLILEANYVTVESGLITDLGIAALTQGESESVYQCTGRADFTGGTHGDEKYDTIHFQLDGKIIDPLAVLALTPGTFVEYRQLSKMFETAATGGVVNPAHPVEALHTKITSFKAGGYKTHNKLIWQNDNIPLSFWYHGISCTARDTATFVQNDFLESATFNADGTQKLSKVGGRGISGFNDVTKCGCKARSYLLKPSNLIDNGQLIKPDELARIFVWDAAAYSKFYRRNNASGSPALGDVWESVTEVEFTYSA